MSPFELYVAGLLLTLVVSVISGYYLTNSKLTKRNSSTYMFWTVVSIALSTISQLLELIASGFFFKYVFGMGVELMLYATVVFWGLFSIEYSGISEKKQKYFRYPAIFIAFITIVLMVLQYNFEVLFQDPYISQPPNSVYTGTDTILRNAIVIITFVFSFASIIILVRFSLINRKTKSVIVFLAFSLVSTVTATVSYSQGYEYSITIISLAFLAIGSLVAARLDMFLTDQIAQSSVYSIISGSIAVFNSRRRLIDYNEEAATSVLNVKGNLNNHASEFLPPRIVKQFDKADEENHVKIEYTFTPLEEYEIEVSRIERDGSHIGYMLFVQDIPELKRATNDIEKRTEQLEQFASFISHDLRNPLNAIQGGADIIEAEVEHEGRENKAASIVKRSTTRMEAIINDLELLFKQSEFDVDFRPVNVKYISQDALGIVEDTSDTTVTLNADDVSVRADQSKFQTILENLFKNAIEHATDSVEVTVSYDRDKERLVITDSGPGFDEETADKMFQAGVSSKGSTGLGLAIVREMASVHGWSVKPDASHQGGKFIIQGVENAS